MNKLTFLLSILVAIELILISAIAFLESDKNVALPTAYVVKETPGKQDFKLITKAVCEQKSEHIVCSDKLFLLCNGTEHAVDKSNFHNFTKCGNTKLDLSNIKVTGNVIFDKEWVDPRKNQSEQPEWKLGLAK